MVGGWAAAMAWQLVALMVAMRAVKLAYDGCLEGCRVGWLVGNRPGRDVG